MTRSVRIAALALATFTLTAASAMADFVPGRVRPGMIAQMTTVEASGVFAQVKGAEVTLDYQDGLSTPVRFTVSIEGSPTMILPITSILPSFCGDRYITDRSDRHVLTTLELVDYSNATCDIYINKLWNITILRKGLNGMPNSLLRLEGNPEAVYVTQ